VAQAAKDADAALKALKEGPEVCLWAARLYARAFSSLHRAAGGRMAPSGLALRFRERGVALVGDALEGLPQAKRRQFWRESVQASADLAPLRGSDRFTGLANTYGSR
jgi:hypothetical protein